MAVVAAPAVRRLGLPTRRRRRSRSRRLPVVSMVVLGLIVLLAVFGGLLTGGEASKGDLSASLAPPVWAADGTWEHPLGTDSLGRDVLARMIAGARTTLLVGGAGVALAGLIGSLVGLLAGYFGGLVDTVLMRITDVVLAIPLLVLGLAVATVLGRGTGNVVVVLTAITWTFYARLVRSEVLRLRETEYVASARLSGVTHRRILRRHILPNILNTIVVVATLQVGYTIIVAASLSFLGLGVPDDVPEWGLMLAEGQAYVSSAWWLSVLPGAALAATVLSANLFGDWLRDRLDPNVDLDGGGPA